LAATNLEVHRGYWYHHLLNYSSFRVEAANDAQNVRINTLAQKFTINRNGKTISRTACYAC